MEPSNDTLKTIAARHSCRNFDPTRQVSDEDVTRILEAAMAAPSACNEQTWHFIVVRDKAVLYQIPTVHPYCSFATKASLAIIVCGDTALEAKGEPGFWVQDCSAAAQNILLAAQSLGLGATWTAVHHKEDRVDGFRRLFNIPANVIPLACIPIGYPAKNQEARPSRFKKDRIHMNSW